MNPQNERVCAFQSPSSVGYRGHQKHSLAIVFTFFNVRFIKLMKKIVAI